MSGLGYEDFIKKYLPDDEKEETRQSAEKAGGMGYDDFIAAYAPQNTGWQTEKGQTGTQNTSRAVDGASPYAGNGTAEEPFQLRMAKKYASGELKSTEQKRQEQQDADKEYRSGLWDFLNTMISNAGAGGAGVIAAPMDAGASKAQLDEAKQKADDAAAAFDKQAPGLRATKALAGWGGRAFGNIGNALLTVGKAYGEGKAISDAYSDSAMLTYAMLGLDPVAEAQKVRDAIQSEQAQQQWDEYRKPFDEAAMQGNEYVQQAKDGAGALGRLAVDAGVGLADLAADQALNAIVPGSGMAAMATSVFGEAAREERLAGGSDAQQMLAGTKAAAIEVLTEKIAGIGGVKGVKTGWIDGLMDKALDRFVANGGNAILGKVVQAFGSEAAEGMISDLLNPIADWALGLKGSWSEAWSDTTAEGVLYDGLLGGLLGMLGGVGEGVQYSRERTMAQAVAAAEQAMQHGMQQNATQEAAGERETQGDIPAPPTWQNASTDDSERLNRTAVTEEKPEAVGQDDLLDEPDDFYWESTKSEAVGQEKTAPEAAENVNGEAQDAAPRQTAKEAGQKLKKTDEEIIAEALRSSDPLSYAEQNSYAAQHKRVTDYIRALLDNPALEAIGDESKRREVLQAYRAGERISSPEALLYSLYADTDAEQTTLARYAEAEGIGDRETAERMLHGLSVNYPELVNYSSTLDLDALDLPANSKAKKNSERSLAMEADRGGTARMSIPVPGLNPKTKRGKAEMKAGRELRKTTGMWNSARDAAEAVHRVAESMRDKGRGSDVMEEARKAADEMLRQMPSGLESGDRELYNKLREYLRGHNIQISDELRGDIPDFNAWRKSMFGKLRLANAGLPIDSAYQELGQIFGEGLFPPDVTAHSDQINRILHLLDATRPAAMSMAQSFDSQGYRDMVEYAAQELAKAAAESVGGKWNAYEPGAEMGRKSEEARRRDAIRLEIDLAEMEGESLSEDEAARIVDERYQHWGIYEVSELADADSEESEDFGDIEEEPDDGDDEQGEEAEALPGDVPAEAQGMADAGDPADGGTGIRPVAGRDLQAERDPGERPGDAGDVNGENGSASADEAYRAAGEKYGVIPEGERPARESAVPQQIRDKGRTGRTARTIYEAGATPESRLQDIRSAVMDGVFEYMPVSNDTLAKRAREKIRRDGWDGALTDWLAEGRSGKRNERLVATGAVLLNNAGNSGMSGAQYVELVTAYHNLVHDEARGLAAARILKTLTPEARLYGITKEVQRINEELEDRQASRRRVTDEDNVPVEEWAQRIGESLAERFGTQDSARPTKSGRTTAQIIEDELRGLIESTLPKAERARTQHDRIADAMDNLGFYNRAYEALRAALAEETDVPAETLDSVVGDWVENDLPSLIMQSVTGNAEVRLDPALIEEYMAQTDEAGRDAVIDRMMHSIADQMPSTFMDKWTALRYTNMLGNFKTQVRNLAGNTAMTVTRMVKDRVGGALEALFQRYGRDAERTKSAWAGKDLHAAAWADYLNVKDVAEGDGKYRDRARTMSRQIDEYRTVFKNGGDWGTENAETELGRSGAARLARRAADAGMKGMEAYRRATQWAMSEGDNIFIRFNYADSLAGYLAANKVKSIREADPELLERARAYAIRQAQEATFHDSNSVSDFASSFDAGWDKSTVGRLAKTIVQGVMPFRKTPANVLVRAEEYSPVGLVNTAVKAIQAAQGKPDVTGADVIESLSKTLTGSALCMLGYLLASGGLARGTGSDDDKLEAFEQQRGAQDYSVSLPDGSSYTLDWLSPSAVPFFMGVNLYEMLGEEQDALDIMTILGSITEPVMNMSMLSGLNDALDNIDKYNGKTEALPALMLNSLFSFATQGITNSLVGQLEQAAEPVRRTSYARKSALPNSIQYAISRAGAKTPGVDFQQQDYIDAWGRRQEQGTAVQRVSQALLNPGNVGTNRSAPVDAELERLYRATGESVLPQRPQRNTKVNGVQLSPEEYEQYAVSKGQLSLELVQGFVESEAYRGMSDADRAETVKGLLDYAADRAKREIATARGESYTSAKWDKLAGAEAAGIDPVDVLLGKKAADVNGSQTLNAAEVYDWVMGLDYGSRQKETLWELYSPSDKALADYTPPVTKVDKLASAGVGRGKAETLTETIGALKPLPGHKGVTDAQKVEAIIGSGLSENEQMQALRLYASESYFSKAQAAADAGISLGSFYESSVKADTNGKGGLSQDELYQFYKSNPEANETFVKVMWLVNGWNTSWDEYRKKAG